jgi:hypothetical protein
MTAKTSTETNGCLDNKKMARRSEPVVNGVVSPTSATGNSERSPKRAKADTEPKDEKKPGAKTEKKVLLPNEPVGIRYEESMRPPSLEGSSRTFMSWNVAGALWSREHCLTGGKSLLFVKDACHMSESDTETSEQQLISYNSFKT